MKKSKAPAKSGSIRVLVADDHVVVREGLVALIGRQDDMTVIAEAANGIEAVAAWREHRPDVTLVDLQMPELDGAGAIEQIISTAPAARIVVLTTFDGDEDIYRGIRAGAKAYLLKDARREELLDCIRAVHCGETCIPSAIAAKLANRLHGEPLTARELDVLSSLAEGRTNKEIGMALDIGEGTVKTHVKSILSKLDATSRTEAAKVATRRGLLRR